MGEPARRRPTGAAVLQQNVTSAITAAAFGELAETGYARMSMDAVARRAGVGKAALYRRWDSKDAMLTDLVARAVREHGLIQADTGTLRGDVEAYIRATSGQLSNPLVNRIALDFLAESPRNPAVAAALREVIARPRREIADALLSRAIRRGELPPDLDHELALDLLAAPLAFRFLVTRGTVDDSYLHHLTEATVAAVRASGKQQSLRHARGHQDDPFDDEAVTLAPVPVRTTTQTAIDDTGCSQYADFTACNHCRVRRHGNAPRRPLSCVFSLPARPATSGRRSFPSCSTLGTRSPGWPGRTRRKQR